MNRKDKIKLLKDLQQGKISPEELIPPTTVLWFYEDGIYELFTEKTKLRFTEAEFKQYTSKRPKQKNLVLAADPGCEPLSDVSFQ
jgi:hypothetical protein